MLELVFERVPAALFVKRFQEILKLLPRSSGDIEKIVLTEINPQTGRVVEYMFVYWKEK